LILEVSRREIPNRGGNLSVERKFVRRDYSLASPSFLRRRVLFFFAVLFRRGYDGVPEDGGEPMTFEILGDARRVFVSRRSTPINENESPRDDASRLISVPRARNDSNESRGVELVSRFPSLTYKGTTGSPCM